MIFEYVSFAALIRKIEFVMQAFSQIVWNVHFFGRFGRFDGKRNQSYAFYISWVWENGWLFRPNFFTIILFGFLSFLNIKIINIHAS